MIKRSITTGLGALTPSAWQDIVAAVDLAVGPSEEGGSAGGRTIAQQRVIDAKITTATVATAGIARWEYDWEQVRRTNGQSTFATFTGAMTSATNGGKKALNILEAGNTASLAYGYPVTSGTSLSNHAGYSFQRVPANAVVQIAIRRDSTGATSFEFQAPNVIDGQCQPQGLIESAFDYGSYASPANAADYGTYLASIGQADFGEYDAPAS
jgi:hypothetical protein